MSTHNIQFCDKRQFPYIFVRKKMAIIWEIFFDFLYNIKWYVECTHMVTHNIQFHDKIRKFS